MIELVLEIDWSEYANSIIDQASNIINSNAVMRVNSPDGMTFVRHIDWNYLARLFIKSMEMRIKYSAFLDKIERRIPGPGELPRHGMTANQVQHYENLRDQGLTLLEEGDRKFRAFKWDHIIDHPLVPDKDEAIQILLRITDVPPV